MRVEGPLRVVNFRAGARAYEVGQLYDVKQKLSNLEVKIYEAASCLSMGFPATISIGLICELTAWDTESDVMCFS